MKKSLLSLASLVLLTVHASAQVDVFSGGPPVSYPNLGSAFAAINGGAHTGSILINLTGNTSEPVSATLNASGSGAANYSGITIQPAGGNAIVGNLAGPLIDLNGARGVVINGNGGLIIDNASTAAGASTIRFIAGAADNAVANCLIRGASSSATSGTILFSTGGATGNTGNTIVSNTIFNSNGNFPVNAIYSAGTSAAIANANTVTNNRIFDYYSGTSSTAAINLSSTGNTAWTITGNRLFQTATRVYSTAATHYGIFVGTGEGYSISGNTIGFANDSATGTTNLIGNSVNLPGFPTSYVAAGTPNATRYIAISAAFTAAGAVSNLQGNRIGGFALYTSSGASTLNGIWCGIRLTSGNAHIGTTTKNIIGAESGNGSIYTAATTTGGTAVGIFASSTDTVTIQNNTIGAVDAVGTASTVAGGFTGIDTAGAGGVYHISSNIIGNADADNIRTGYTLNAGSLSNAGTLASTSGGLTPALVGIRCTATGATKVIDSNTLRGWAVSGALIAVTGITASGTSATSVSTSSNLLGTAARGWVRYAFANGNALTGVSATGTAAATTVLNVNANDFRGIVNSALCTHDHTYVTYNTGLKSNVNANTFNNLNVNTSGAVTLLNRLVSNSLPATGTLSVSSNQIVTGFTKAAAGNAVTGYTGGGASVNGSTILANLNNFSNITCTGTTGVILWSDSDGQNSSSGPTKTISNNTFNNVTTGAGAQLRGILVNSSGDGSAVTGNTLTNFTSGGTIVAFSTQTSHSGTTQTIASNTFSNYIAGGQVNVIATGLNTNLATGHITGNTIGNITSTSAGANPVLPILCSGFGATTNISRNKIFNVQSDGNALAGSVIYGIAVQTGGAIHNIFNNYIGDLRMPAANGANNLVGINIGTLTAATNVNVSFNTVWLNAPASSGAAFGSSALSASTTPNVVLRSNILVNTSAFMGSGQTVAYRRSSPTLTTYGAASDSNDFYAGVPGPNNLIFADGTNADQTMAAYQVRVATRDGRSFTENPPFLSTTGSNPNFLHIDPAVPTQLESGGLPVAGVTDDFDGDLRHASVPDVGADEFAGSRSNVSPPVITFTPLGNSLAGMNRMLTANITAQSGVPVAGAGLPRLYFQINAGGYNPVTGVSVGGNQYTFTFGSGAVTTGDVVSYYVVAQDGAATPNVIAQPSQGAAGYTANPPAVATPPTTPFTYVIAPGLSGNKTVGAGGDYPNLGAAITALAGSVVTGPVHLALTDATYTETFPIVIPPLTGVSSTNTVTIKPGVGVSTTFTGTSGADCVLTLNAADWIVLDGSNTVGGTTRDLTFVSANTGAAGVICLKSNGSDGATHNTIKNVVAIGTSVTGTLVGLYSGGAAIGVAGTASGNNHNTFQNNDVRSVQYGIYSGGLSAAAKNTGNVITQNVLNFGSPNLGQGGILVNFESGIVISNNRIGNVSATVGTATAFGISLGLRPFNTFTAFTGSESEGALISGNVIDNVTRTNDASVNGIAVAAVSEAGSAPNVLRNNVISRIVTPLATPSDFACGLLLGGGAQGSTVVQYNSISMSGSGPTSSPTFAIAIGGANPVVQLRNNIVHDVTVPTTTGKIYAIGLAYGAPFTNLSSDYNLFYSTGANAFFGESTALGSTGADVATLADWRTLTGGDANSKFADPLFVSTSNLHLQAASPASNAGTVIGGVTTDLDGNPRSALRPDVGAYELAPSAAATNLAVSAGTLTPAFASGTLAYTDLVANAVADLTVTPTAADTNAVIAVRVNGGGFATVASGSPSALLPLNVGTNSVEVRLTPELGAAQTYTVTVTRLAILTAGNLSYNVPQGYPLTIPHGDLISAATFTPGFAPTVLNAGPTSANGGTIGFSAGVSVTYHVPAPTFTGADSFSYTLTNSLGQNVVGTITLTVVAPAFPPTSATVTRTSGTVTAAFTGGVPGLTYTIQYSPNLLTAFATLLDGGGQPVTATANGAGGFTFSDPTSVGTKGFYRAVYP